MLKTLSQEIFTKQMQIIKNLSLIVFAKQMKTIKTLSPIVFAKQMKIIITPSRIKTNPVSTVTGSIQIITIINHQPKKLIQKNTKLI